MTNFQSNYVIPKTMYNKSNFPVIASLALVMIVLISACGGLAGEPKIVSTLAPMPT